MLLYYKLRPRLEVLGRLSRIFAREDFESVSRTTNLALFQGSYMQVRELANFIWSVADLLRGDYKQADYGKVILPLTVLRRMDCVLAPTKAKVLEVAKTSKFEEVLNRAAKQKFHNKSKFDFAKIAADPNSVAANLSVYIKGFSTSAREIIEKFEFENQIRKLEESELLFEVVKRFASIDLHPNEVSNIEMGYIFEELIRKFAEISNETAGEHFTPREVIRLMVNILFLNDREILAKEGIIKTLYDPACGTGGMLSVAEEHVLTLNKDAQLKVFGQELNAESYAICKADMLIKGEDPANVKFGNSFSQDGLPAMKFDYLLSNPPFGVDWKKVQTVIDEEHDELGFGGRFGAGLPRINDGSFLFLQHMISKMNPSNGGSRLAIVFNGSPLFTGSAGSGESNIRQWIIENDMLEAIIALPDQLFYNTGISTYIWVVTNRKEKKRKGKVQLVNAVSFFQKMSRSLGNKRNEISSSQIEEITKIYGAFKESEFCKIFDNSDFGYSRVTVERALLDEKGKPVLDKKGNPKPNAELRDSENIPLKDNIQEYFEREVLPHVPDAWIDETKTKIGYEINFTKYFYKYHPLRSLEEIRSDILALEEETEGMLKGVLA
jgi:type I restriction enzyme M protein